MPTYPRRCSSSRTMVSRAFSSSHKLDRNCALLRITQSSARVCSCRKAGTQLGRGQGCGRREGASEAAPAAVRQAVGGGAKAVGGGYCRLQMPLKPAPAVRGTVAGRRLGALEGGGGTSPLPMHPWPRGGGCKAHATGASPPPRSFRGARTFAVGRRSGHARAREGGRGALHPFPLRFRVERLTDIRTTCRSSTFCGSGPGHHGRHRRAYGS